MLKSVVKYLSHAQKSSEFLKNSIDTSVKDIIIDASELVKNPTASHLINLTKDTVGSLGWIANSTIDHLLVLGGIRKSPEGILSDPESQFIVEKVSKNIPLDPNLYPPEKIFSALFKELEYCHTHKHYKSKLNCPKIFPTIVLVSGMLNEIYKTAAFERGVSNTSRKNGLKYLIANVSGYKGSRENSHQIRDIVYNHHKLNPDEKFWFLCYSKGGIDAMYFFKENSDWVKRNVVGMSTLATPILGSPHLNKGHLKFAVKIRRALVSKIPVPNSEIQSIFDESFQQSIDMAHQKSWFLKNYHLLPQNLFYTSMALNCEWYESHIYMMLTKLLLPSSSKNDGVVDADSAIYPKYFNGINLGLYKGHHLIAARSSTFSQEALIEAHLILLKYLNLI